MNAGNACRQPHHKPYWRVVQRNCNHSAFNGYHWTPSDYSMIICMVQGCPGCWRSKGRFVADIPDAQDWPNYTPVRLT
jgi:hypothetical protein